MGLNGMTAPEDRLGEEGPDKGRDEAEELVRGDLAPVAGRVESDGRGERRVESGDGRGDEPVAVPVGPEAPGWRLSFTWMLSSALCRR